MIEYLKNNTGMILHFALLHPTFFVEEVEEKDITQQRERLL
jgi:hypothetical protein